jgi:hypothetical protein
MTAKEYLRSVRNDESRYISKCERLRDMAGYGCGQKEAERISGDPARSRVENCVVALVDLERKMQGKAVSRVNVDRQAEAVELIRKIPRELYREVLFLYYCESLDWKQVAKTVGRSERQIHYIHGWALQIFEEILRRR